MTKTACFIMPDKVGGVEYHRMEVPIVGLMDSISIRCTNSIMEPEAYDQINPSVVVANRKISLYGAYHNIDTIQFLKSKGIPYIIDIDDYWHLNKDHMLKAEYKQHSITEQCIESMEGAAEVWVTHERLADKAYRHNKNVVIIPNAIDFDQPQFKFNRKDWQETRIGWAGGTTHVKDIELLTRSMRQLHRDMKLKGKFVTMLSVADNPIFRHYEWIMTGGGIATPKDYQRVPWVDVYNYAKMYDFFNIALAPLVDNEFNKCKSNLKALEAGAKGCAIITSNIHPYTDIIEHGVTGLLVSDNNKGWKRAMQMLINDKEMVRELAINLHNKVKSEYNIKKINEIRKERLIKYL